MKKRWMGTFFLLCAGIAAGAEWFVRPGVGGNGSREKPFGSIAAALDHARKQKGGSQIVTLLPGEYELTKTIQLDQRDEGLTLRAEKPGTVILYGGQRLSGWVPDGEKFWSVSLPEVQSGKIDFRALVVNGRMADRACYPGGGKRLENLGQWNVRLLPALAGWWERKPTREELCSMPYKPEDLPATLDIRNAEIRLYHMWSESLVGVSSNDVKRHILTLSSPADWPAGACGRRQYVVYNTREGMTAPGQWYLDRTNGKVVYWPLPGERRETLQAVAPLMERVLAVRGTSNKLLSHVTLSGFSIRACTPPLKSAGFGGGNLDGALSVANVTNCVIDTVEISQVGGCGVRLARFDGSVMRNCDIHQIGARGLSVSGKNALISSNRIVKVGLLYPSSSAVGAGGEGIHFFRNEISESPYSGMIIGGRGHLIEGNLISRVMQTLHDGAAIYGGMVNCVIRENIVRDVVPAGAGFGASAYYLDEGSTDCLVERNIAEDVPRPIHNHITRNVVVRDNVFLAQGDVTISFQNSVNGVFDRNRILAKGKLKTNSPNSLRSWEGNAVYQLRDPEDPEGGYQIGNAKPENPQLPPQKHGIPALRVANPPVPDGAARTEEWPGVWSGLSRDCTRRKIGGAPAFVRAAYDDQNLYVAAQVSYFRTAEISKGSRFGVDDGVVFEFDGKRIEGYACGEIRFSDPSWQGSVRGYAGYAKNNRGMGKLLTFEFVIPLRLLGGVSAKEIPFNARAFYGTYQEWRCWEAPEGAKPTGKITFK